MQVLWAMQKKKHNLNYSDMKLLKVYVCDGTPKDDEILEGIEIAKREDCLVRLEWFVKYNGWFSRIIDKDSDLDAVKNNLPKTYGL